MFTLMYMSFANDTVIQANGGNFCSMTAEPDTDSL